MDELKAQGAFIFVGAVVAMMIGYGWPAAFITVLAGAGVFIFCIGLDTDKSEPTRQEQWHG